MTDESAVPPEESKTTPSVPRIPRIPSPPSVPKVPSVPSVPSVPEHTEGTTAPPAGGGYVFERKPGIIYILSPRGQPLMELESIDAEGDRIRLQGRLMGRFASRMYSAPGETSKLLRKITTLRVVGYLLRWPSFWSGDTLARRQAPADLARRADRILLVVLAAALTVFLGTLGWLAAAAGRTGPLLFGAALGLAPAAVLLASPLALTAALILLVFSWELAVVGWGGAVLSQAPLVGLPLLTVYVVGGELLARRWQRHDEARAFNRAATVAATLSTVFVLFQVTPFLKHGIGAAMPPLVGYTVFHALRWRETGTPLYGFLMSVTVTLAVLLGLTGGADQAGSGLVVPMATLAGTLALASAATGRVIPPRWREGLAGALPPPPVPRGVWPVAGPSLVVGSAVLASAWSEWPAAAAASLVLGTAYLTAWLFGRSVFSWTGVASCSGYAAAAAGLAFTGMALTDGEELGWVAATAAGWAAVLALVALTTSSGSGDGATWVDRARVRLWAARGAASGASAFGVAAVVAVIERAEGAEALALLIPAAAWLLAAVWLEDRGNAGVLAIGAAAGAAAAAITAAVHGAGDTEIILVSVTGAGLGLVAWTAAGAAFVHVAIVGAAFALAALADVSGLGDWSGAAPLAVALTAAVVAWGRPGWPWLATAAYAGAAVGVAWSPALAGAAAAVLLVAPQPWGEGTRGRWPRVHEIAAGILVGASVIPAALDMSDAAVTVGLMFAAAGAGVALLLFDRAGARWSPAVGAAAIVMLPVATMTPATALGVAGVLVGLVGAVALAGAALERRAEVGQVDAAEDARVADAGPSVGQAWRLTAGVASLPVAGLALFLLVDRPDVSTGSAVLALDGLVVAALGAWGGLSAAIPLAAWVPAASVLWLAGGDSADGMPFVAAATGSAVALLAVMADPIGRRAGADDDEALVPDEPPAEVGLVRRRAGEAATAAAVGSLTVTVLALTLAGHDRAASAGLWALVATLVLAVARRAPQLLAVAGIDVALMIFRESSRVQGKLNDTVALWFLGLTSGVALAFLVSRISAAEGRRAARALAWTGQNRAVLAVGYSLAVVALIGLAIAGAAIAIRDPLVRTGIDDLMARLGDWMDAIAA